MDNIYKAKIAPPCHNAFHFCHTTLYLVILKALAEVSQKQKRDFSLASLPQNDKIISELESKIDDLVYALYELTQDEIQIVEST